jgi:undecaprenyl-diphosphatase
MIRQHGAVVDSPILLPASWQRPVAVVAVFGGLGALGLGWRYAGMRTAGPLDRAVGSWFGGPDSPHEPLLWALSIPGSPPGLLLGLIILVSWAVRTRRGSAVVLAVVGPLSAVLLTEFVLKPIIDRTHDGTPALPSGHATSIAAQAAVYFLAFAASGRPGNRWLRRVLGAAAGLAVIGVSVGMVGPDRHYATDTVAGVLVGASVVSALALALNSWATRRLSQPPVRARR